MISEMMFGTKESGQENKSKIRTSRAASSQLKMSRDSKFSILLTYRTRSAV